MSYQNDPRCFDIRCFTLASYSSDESEVSIQVAHAVRIGLACCCPDGSHEEFVHYLVAPLDLSPPPARNLRFADKEVKLEMKIRKRENK
jgi:hypothetical protein